MSEEKCPANRICQCHRNGDGICLMLNKAKQGGVREGSGRKPKPYKQKQMGIRVPAVIFERCVQFCKNETIIFEKSLRNQK